MDIASKEGYLICTKKDGSTMYLEKASVESIYNTIVKMQVRRDQVVLIALAHKNRPDIQSLIKRLNNAQISFMGGVFPGVIDRSASYDEGALVWILPCESSPFLVRDLSITGLQLPGAEVTGHFSTKYTAMIFVDGLSSNIGKYLDTLYNQLGNSVNYVGGGAGGADLKQQPCVFTSEGVFQDAAVVALIKQESHLGMCHGWKRMFGPIVTTRTEANRIVELNWENAFAVYKYVIEKYAGKKINTDNFSEIANDYPLGFIKENAESVVRDAREVNSAGELTCYGEVPENTVVDILTCDKQSFLEAAKQVAACCNENAKGKVAKQAIIIECVARKQFLKEDFTLELAAVRESISENTGTDLVEGMLSLGEIASGQGFLHYFNKTIVTAVFYE